MKKLDPGPDPLSGQIIEYTIVVASCGIILFEYGGKGMARFRRLDVLQAMMDSGLVPVFYHKDLETAKKVARAAADGGVKVLEFTNRGDFAYQIFSALIQWCESEIPDLILGVGSVIDPGTFRCISTTAPTLSSVRSSMPRSPRMQQAEDPLSAGLRIRQRDFAGGGIRGGDLQDLPGKEVGGPAFVKNILGPMPWTLIMPTGGVETTRESIEAWFKAGVACVGVGSNLISKELIAAGDFAAIAKKTADVLTWINEVRKK